MSTATFVLHPTGPFNFSFAVSRNGHVDDAPSPQGEIVRAIWCGATDGDRRREGFSGPFGPAGTSGRAVVLSCRARGDVEGAELVVRAAAPRLRIREVEHARATAAHMFALDVDLRAFYAAVGHDPVMRRLVRRYYGLRPLLSASVFEAIASAIMAQQVSLGVYRHAKRAVLERYGAAVGVEGTVHRAFPPPAALAVLPRHALRACKLSDRKSEFIVDLARAVCDGRLDLRRETIADSRAWGERLQAERGIGPWTVECVRLFGLGDRDVLPSGDLGLQVAVQRLYKLRARPTPLALDRRSRRWLGWRGYAAHYLWFARGDQAGRAGDEGAWSA